MNVGYTATTANLLTVPVYVLACIVTCTVGFLADRYGNRGLFNLYVLDTPQFFIVWLTVMLSTLYRSGGLSVGT